MKNNTTGSNLLLLFLALFAFTALFLLLGYGMRFLPDPIGPRSDLFIEGAKVTLYLTVTAGVLGLFLGIIMGLLNLSKNWLLRAPVMLIISFVRGTPLLVQILFAYYAVPEIIKAIFGWMGVEWDVINAIANLQNSFTERSGIELSFSLSEFIPAMVALAVNVGAYNAEVIRGGIQAIAPGQNEAARSLGLTGTQTMMLVILPQATRIVIPPLVNNLVALLKDTSLASSIALLELNLTADRIRSETLQAIPVLTTLAVLYWMMTAVLTFFTDIIERRFKTKSR